MNSRNCPDLEEIYALAEGGRLSKEKRAILQEHLKACDLCLKEIYLIKRMLMKGQDQKAPVPHFLKEKALQLAMAGNPAEEAKWNISEFVFNVSQKGVTFVKNLLLPPGARFTVFYPPLLPAEAFRNGAAKKTEEAVVEEIFGDISIKILIDGSSWPAVRMKVKVNKKDMAFKNKRVSLYLEDSLLSSKMTSSEGMVDFPDIRLGRYAVKVPQEVIDLRIRLE